MKVGIRSAGSSSSIPVVALEEWQDNGEHIREHLRPTVVRGAFSDVVLRPEWSFEGLGSVYGSQRVKMMRRAVEGGIQKRQLEERVAIEWVDFAEFLDLMRDDGHGYQLLQQSLTDFDGLVEKLQPTRMAVEPFYAVNLWIGSGTRSRLHYDLAENVLIQVYGTKEVLLQPPDSTAGRYVHDDCPHVSKVDPRDPDMKQFPEYLHPDQYVAELHAGDALYLPPQWYHDVIAPNTSMSINVWFGRQLQFIGSPPAWAIRRDDGN